MGNVYHFLISKYLEDIEIAQPVSKWKSTNFHLGAFSLMSALTCGVVVPYLDTWVKL